MSPIDISHTNEIYTVSRLNREARLLLEGNFLSLWVEGEISNFVAPHSGHWYFSLKDATAQIKCAMFKPQNHRLAFTPKDGMHIIAKARVSLYEGRGDFQLLVEFLEDVGVGKLQKEFEALKKRLSDAGLFDIHKKKKLPAIPHCIGIITSATGAALRDILHVLTRRFPCVPIIIYPTLVQGESAATSISRAIELANQRQECDVLILARGGGSLEDLWSFNEEVVAHAIYRSDIPIITGVGHEIDFTIADFVADVRAPTPSAAAELITPDTQELLFSIIQLKKQLVRLIQQKIIYFQQHFDWMAKQLQQQHPKYRLREQTQQLDVLELTLTRLQCQLLNNTQAKVRTYSAKLKGLTPSHGIRELQQRLKLQMQRLPSGVTNALQTQQQNLSNAAAKLDTLSPLATLQRGYAIAMRGTSQTIVRSIAQVTEGDLLTVRVIDGEIVCSVIDN